MEVKEGFDMKLGKLFLLVTLLVFCDYVGGSVYELSKIETKPMEYSPTLRMKPPKINRQILGPYRLDMTIDLETERLHISCNHYDSDVEDRDTIKIEKIMVSSSDGEREIAGKMLLYSNGVGWISDRSTELLNLCEGDTVKGVISARIATEKYIYHDVEDGSEIKANGIDFKVCPCPHSDCYKGFALPEKQKDTVRCITASIDKAMFKDASVRASCVLMNNEIKQSGFRHSERKSEVCFKSLEDGQNIFPIEVEVIKYEPVTMNFAIDCSPQKMHEYAIELREYVNGSSSHWKRYTILGIILVLAGIVGVWSFAKSRP